MVYYGVGFNPNQLLVPIVLLGVVILTVGLGSFLAGLTVTYRDVRYVVPFLTQMWFYATPVLYPPGLVPEGWRWVLWMNPMTGFVEGFRSAFLGRAFDPGGLAVSFAVSTFILLAGLAHFERTERAFADVM
jgi:lipopolysaccharide transport system permease protein